MVTTEGDKLALLCTSIGISEQISAEHPMDLAVLPVQVEWSDLREPQRIIEYISRTGIHPKWAVA
jgi:hypothetical protein